MVLFGYYLLGGDSPAPSGLFASLCHAFLVFSARCNMDILDRFSQSFHHMKALYMEMMDLYLIFQFVKGRFHGNQIMLP